MNVFNCWQYYLMEFKARQLLILLEKRISHLLSFKMILLNLDETTIKTKHNKKYYNLLNVVL